MPESIAFLKGIAGSQNLQTVSETDPLPVSINDTAPSYDVSGENAVPAANTIIADTGPVAAGSYKLIAFLGIADTVAAGKGIHLQVRDAANAVTLKRVITPAAQVVRIEIPRIALLLNERVRATNVVVGAAASMYTAWIQLYPVD